MIRSFTLFALALPLAGCARDQGQIPSLLPRAIEDRSDAEPDRPAVIAAPDPALDAELAGLLAARAKITGQFAAADRAAAARLAAGAKAAVGSDAWLDAQTALAALDEPRAALLGVLTELEQLAIARASAGQPAYPALDAARADVAAELDRMTLLVAQRQAALPL